MAGYSTMYFVVFLSGSEITTQTKRLGRGAYSSAGKEND